MGSKAVSPPGLPPGRRVACPPGIDRLVIASPLLIRPLFRERTFWHQTGTRHFQNIFQPTAAVPSALRHFTLPHRVRPCTKPPTPSAVAAPKVVPLPGRELGGLAAPFFPFAQTLCALRPCAGSLLAAAHLAVRFS